MVSKHRKPTPPPGPRSRPYTRPAVVAAVAGATIALGTAAVYAAAVVHGRADLVVQQAAVASLVASDIHLSGLIPGAATDLYFTVRNPGKVSVTADRITALLPLRDARPAGCADKVSGPLIASNGLRLAGQPRRTLAPDESQQITVPNALRLAASARTGCGFRVTVDVQAIQAPDSTSSTTQPSASPSVSAIAVPPAHKETAPTPPNQTAPAPPTQGGTTTQAGTNTAAPPICTFDPITNPDCPS